MSSSSAVSPQRHDMERNTTEKPKSSRKQKGVRGFFKRSWRAIKHTFSSNRGNQVESLSSHPDLDPYDPQPGPSGQTNLHVFEPPAHPEPANLLPGSCNWEQAAPEDQEDPQPGPSGLEPAASKKQADHQLDPSNQDPDDTKTGSSGLEPSALQDQVDTQTDPSVFEPTGLKEQADSQHASTNVNPTASEADQPPDPSNLEKNPADSRPSQKRSKRRKKKGVRGFFKRSWRAIKHTFSSNRGNQVESLSSQPDLDPYDPQPGPSGQTNLHVFEPPAHPEPADLLPGSCNWEQAAPEDPEDPQPGPSGLEPAAPKDQSDPQPGPSGLEPTAPKEQSDSQPGPSNQDLLKINQDPYYALSKLAPQNRDDSRVAREIFYKMGKELGSGGFGTVYEGTRRSDGRKVAMKFCSKLDIDFYFNIPLYFKPLYSEVAINLLLQTPEKCPYIVELLDWFEEEHQHVLILEFPHPCVTLFDLIEKRGHLSEKLARNLMRQAVIACKHCIDHGVFHGDLKLDNVLVNTETMELKLIDFGCSELSSVGYCRSIAPKFAVSETVCSLGVMLVKMVRGHDILENMYTVRKTDPSLFVGLSEEFHDVKDRCLSLPTCRPTLEELLEHEWFKQS